MMLPNTQEPVAAVSSTGAPPAELGSVFDMVLDGGPLMIPIALCSVVSVAYIVERSIRLREGELGSRHYGRRILDVLTADGPGKAQELCERDSKPLGRVLGAALGRSDSPVLELEKAVEDAGAREVKRLNANLKPLVVVGLIAPLLGLLGTVWGMIEAFSSIAVQDGLGKPELLASGISQALITTAAGLTVAIPTQAAYFWLRGRIDRFVNRAEDLYGDLQAGLERFRAPQLDTGAEA
jgi:biopolymer transport protein ExbB